jgi:hypothetical protein
MIEVNKDNFEAEVLQAGGVVLVDWWGPMRTLSGTDAFRGRTGRQVSGQNEILQR